MEAQMSAPGAATFESVWAMIQSLGQEIKEFRQSFAHGMEELRQRQEETDKQIKATDEQMKITGLRMQATDKQISRLGHSFGAMVEHLIAPNIMEKFNAFGYHFEDVVSNYKQPGKTGILFEVDLWLQNGDYAAAVEVKAHLESRDVKDHVERMEKIRDYLKSLGDDRKLIGAVAGAVVSSEVKKQALDKGFFLATQSGDTVNLDKPHDIKIW